MPDRVTGLLNVARAEVKQAKLQSKGLRNDAAIQSLARAADNLEQASRVIVRVLQGDETATKELTEDDADATQ